MTKWLSIFLQFFVSLFRAQRGLAFENLLLRQQLAVLKEKGGRPQVSPTDRSFWVLVSKLWPKWRDALHIVKPETVIRWHQEGFRRHWARKCRKKGRPGLDPKIKSLIRRMSQANPLWGAPRIHGELLKLGIEVSQTTVAKYLVRDGKPPWQNAYAERVIGTIRRECLDHAVILGGQHLRRIVKSYVSYYNGVRTHLSLDKDAPRRRRVQNQDSGPIRSRRHCGGLHHEYYRKAA